MDAARARQIIQDMDAHKIVWDDNLRAQANNALKSGGGGGLNIPAFSFDYAQAEAEARAKLEPYYAQKLADAKGDVERAKRLIEEDYARGMRTSEEDKASQLASDTATAKEETQSLLEGLNKRGLLFGEIPMGQQTSAAPYSQLAQTQELNPLSDKQALRKQAIERAIARQEEVAGVTRQRGIEEQNIQYPRTEQALLEEKENKVQTQYVPLAEERARARYENTYQQSLNQAINQSLSANKYLQQLGWS